MTSDLGWAEAELGRESRDGPGQCPKACRHFYHGVVRLAVAWGEWRAVARCPGDRFFHALRELAGMALNSSAANTGMRLFSFVAISRI